MGIGSVEVTCSSLSRGMSATNRGWMSKLNVRDILDTPRIETRFGVTLSVIHCFVSEGGKKQMLPVQPARRYSKDWLSTASAPGQLIAPCSAHVAMRHKTVL